MVPVDFRVRGPGNINRTLSNIKEQKWQKKPKSCHLSTSSSIFCCILPALLHITDKNIENVPSHENLQCEKRKLTP